MEDADSAFDGIGDAADSESVETDGSQSNGAGTGTLENPTPEASGALDTDTIRIGDLVWSPSTTDQCVVQAADDPLQEKAFVSGDLDAEGTADYRFSYEGHGAVEGQLFGNTMFWMAGERDGSELTFDVDFDAGVISGTGLFYNGHTNEWAYGSFMFECGEGG